MGDEATWLDSVEDEGVKESLGQFENQDALFEAIGYKSPDPEKVDTPWGEGFDDDLKETADRFASKQDAVRAIQSFRKRESQVRVPGKDASDEEIASYQKAIGVPESAAEYEFPEVSEDDMTDEIKASRETWANHFKELNISKDTAKALSKLVGEDAAKDQEAQIEADKAFVEKQEAALRSEWKGEDYDKNMTLANRAFKDVAERAGIDIESLNQIETKDGRLLMDRPEFSKMFAAIGREMSEGSLGMSDSERGTAEDQVSDIRKQISEAQARGDSKAANSLFSREQELLDKIEGSNQGKVA